MDNRVFDGGFIQRGFLVKFLGGGGAGVMLL
jgi:hypothetical protein